MENHVSVSWGLGVNKCGRLVRVAMGSADCPSRHPRRDFLGRLVRHHGVPRCGLMPCSRLGGYAPSSGVEDRPRSGPFVRQQIPNATWCSCGCGVVVSRRAVWGEGGRVAEEISGWVATSQRGRRTCRSEVSRSRSRSRARAKVSQPARTRAARAGQNRATQCSAV